MVIGIIVSALGLIGYSAGLAGDYSKYLKVTLVFCAFMSMTFVIYGLIYFFDFDFANMILALLLSLAALYLASNVKLEGLNAERFKNGLIYASMVWLTAKSLSFVGMLPLTVALIAIPVLYFAIKSIRALDRNDFYFFDDTEVIYMAFLVILVGGMAVENLHAALLIAVVLTFYTFYRLYRNVRFLI